MTTRSKLKSELVTQYLDFGKEFFDMVGIPANERKKNAKALVATAQDKAEDTSEAALRAAFNVELLAEGKLVIRSLAAAFSAAAADQDNSRVPAAAKRNERVDIEAHRQPKQHKLPSGSGSPTY